MACGKIKLCSVEIFSESCVAGVRIAYYFVIFCQGMCKLVKSILQHSLKFVTYHIKWRAREDLPELPQGLWELHENKVGGATWKNAWANKKIHPCFDATMA